MPEQPPTDPEAFLRLLSERDRVVGSEAERVDDALRLARLIEAVDRQVAARERMLARTAELEAQLAQSTARVHELEQQLAARGAEVEESRSRLAEKDARLDAITRSRAFKVSSLYWRISDHGRRTRS